MNAIPKKIFWSIATVAGAARLAIACAPFTWLLRRAILADDAFYYFEIARNFVSGFGITFDRLTPTNGFHPLWFFLISPLFALVPDRIMLVHAVLILGAIFGMAGFFFLARVCRQLDLRPAASGFVLVLYALSPALLFASGGTMTGMETSLVVFLLLAYTSIYLTVVKNIRGGMKVSRREWLWFGLAAGFLFLARTDNAIFLAVSGLTLFGWIMARQRAAWRGFAASVALALLMALPWLAWSYRTFGELVQVSGKTIAFMTHEALAAEGWGVVDYILKYLKNCADALAYGLGLLITSKFSPEFIALMLVTALFGGWFLASYLRKAPASTDTKTKMSLMLTFWVAALIFILAQTIRLINLRPWYNSSVVPFVLVALGLALDYMVRTLGPRGRRILLALGAVFALVIFVSLRTLFVPQAGELGKYTIIRQLNGVLPQGSRVGAWNAGIYGYFFDRGTLVNLDGVVNNAVYPFIKEHKVGIYAAREGIEYIVDERATLEGVGGDYWSDDGFVRGRKVVASTTPDMADIMAIHL